MLVKYLVVLIPFLVAVHAICPNDCNSPFGSCNREGECVCTGNWQGADCSIYDQYLNSGEISRDEVSTGSWKYYRHTVGSAAAGTTLVWWMNQTDDVPGANNESPDGDLYIQLDTYPTRAHYLARNVTVEQNNIVVIENAEPGVYYAGVYGYSAVRYAISVSESEDCPNNCFGNGDCIQGECICYTNFGGEDCEYEYRRLSQNSPVVGEVSQYAWEYFFTEVGQAGVVVEWVVTELSDGSASDCDLYLALGRAPTLWDWDYANVTIGDESSIILTDAQEGRYTLGVYGYFQCSFRASVTISSPEGECTNQCSLHGTCDGGVCNCNPGFQGETCEWMNPPLVLDRAQTGYVGRNSWNYYNTRVVTQSALVITLTQTTSGDCDLYVRADDKPTRFEFDYVDLSLKEEYSIYIREPGDHTWYIGVFGWETCAYSMILDEALVCACGLENPHGDCRVGSNDCFCHEGWSGDDCSSPLVVLENMELHSSSVKKFEWRYFEVQIANSTTGTISIREKSSTGLLWLFVSFTGEPTLSSYDLSEKETNHDIHEISIATASPQSRSLFVGVYGNPYGTHDNLDLDFDIIAWSAPF